MKAEPNIPMNRSTITAQNFTKKETTVQTKLLEFSQHHMAANGPDLSIQEIKDAAVARIQNRGRHDE